jgi:hypothetical protein
MQSILRNTCCGIAHAYLEQPEQRFAAGDWASEAVFAETLIARYPEGVEDGSPESLDAHGVVLDLGAGLVRFALHGAAADPATGKDG